MSEIIREVKTVPADASISEVLRMLIRDSDIDEVQYTLDRIREESAKA